MTGMIETSRAEVMLAEARNRLELATGPIAKARAMAAAVVAARTIVGQHIDEFVELGGTQIGFAIDDKTKYTKAQIADCVTQALVCGDSIVGNEWAIIGGRYYRQLAGWESAFGRIPGAPITTYRIGSVEHVTEPTYDATTRRGTPGVAKVEAAIEFAVRGEIISVEYRDNTSSGGFDERLLIRVNKGMGDDGVIGKAKARLMKALYRQWRGESRLSPSADDGEAIESTVVVAAGPPAASAEVRPEVEPGSIQEYHQRAMAAKTHDELMAISAEYRFEGPAIEKGNALYLYHKKRLNA